MFIPWLRLCLLADGGQQTALFASEHGSSSIIYTSALLNPDVHALLPHRDSTKFQNFGLEIHWTVKYHRRTLPNIVSISYVVK